MNKTSAFLKQTLVFKTWKGSWGEVRLWINLTFIYFFGSINTVSFLCVRSQLTEMTSCNSNENNVLWGFFLGAPCTADDLNQYPSIPLPPTWGPSTATKGYFVSSLCSYKLVLQNTRHIYLPSWTHLAWTRVLTLTASFSMSTAIMLSSPPFTDVMLYLDTIKI